MYLKNAWYVAALEREVGTGLVPVKVLGEPVVVYRKQDGTLVGLEDACPHRKLPLSMGRLKGDQVECGYHGLMFDGTGTCTKVPGAEKIPHVARVRAYPVHARYGFIWIWMGEARLADPAKITHVDFWGEAGWGHNQPDSMLFDCNYLYIADNLLDPSHVSWVHQSSFGGAGTEDTPIETTLTEGAVTAWRWLPNADPAPFYAPLLKFQGKADRKQHYEMRYPSNMLARAIFTPAGHGGEGNPDHADVFYMDSYNFLTPIDDKTTRYFWFQMRNVRPDDAALSAQMNAGIRAVFEEDRLVLNAVQKGMDNKLTPNLDLKIDTAPLRFRRRLAQMIAAEQALNRAAAE
ncbi:MAG: Rieske 2Fe-2S domain-containing protein [Hyphomicrobiaceae bacterium]